MRIATSIMLVLFSLFMVSGLIYSMRKRRAGEEGYFLFWKRPFGEQGARLIPHGSARGKAAELSRVVFFLILGLVGIAGLIDQAAE